MGFKAILKTVALVSVPIGVTFLDCFGYVARVEGKLDFKKRDSHEIKYFFFNKGVSMQPALNPEAGITDYVFLSSWKVRDFQLNRGDIVALISPKDPDQKIIKRIVGLQGELVRTLSYRKEFVRVPEGHCWVEGDHTGNSLDSNTFGPVAQGLITARATLVVWPPSRWQSIKSDLPKTRIRMKLSELK